MPTTEPRLHRHAVSVAFGDCDPYGIVFYANFFRWFDQSAWGLFAGAGLPFPELERRFRFAGMPLLELRTGFAAPCRWREELTVETAVSEWRRKVFILRHVILGGGEKRTECFETRAWTVQGDGGIRAVPIPDEVRALLGGAPQQGREA